MQELARRAELSQPFLSKVERGVAFLSMRALDRVAHALGTTAVGLFGGMASNRSVEIVRVDDRPELPTYDAGTAVAHALTSRAGQMRVVEFDGGPTEYPDEMFVHRNDSLSIVLAGTYEFDVDGEQHLLAPGDTLSAAGGIAQRYRVLEEPARLMVVIVSEDVHVVADPATTSKATNGRRRATSF